MLLPTALPSAMSRSPLSPAMIEVAASGSDVPTATTVRPMTSSLTPSSARSSRPPDQLVGARRPGSPGRRRSAANCSAHLAGPGRRLRRAPPARSRRPPRPDPEPWRSGPRRSTIACRRRSRRPGSRRRRRSSAPSQPRPSKRPEATIITGTSHPTSRPRTDQRGDQGREAEHQQDVRDVAADDIADADVGLVGGPGQGRPQRHGQLRRPGAEGHDRQSDDQRRHADRHRQPRRPVHQHPRPDDQADDADGELPRGHQIHKPPPLAPPRIPPPMPPRHSCTPRPAPPAPPGRRAPRGTDGASNAPTITRLPIIPSTTDSPAKAHGVRPPIATGSPDSGGEARRRVRPGGIRGRSAIGRIAGPINLVQRLL